MKKYYLFLILLACTNLAHAQSNWTTLHGFSKNRVQYKSLNWRTIKSNHFEINFHQGGEKFARTAAQHLETVYPRITGLMSYTPFDDMKIYIYNTTPDMEQSNMGLTAPITLDGGMLNLAKSRIEIAHNGNDNNFKKEITYQTTRLFVYDMLYGGNLKEALQSTLLLTVPDWFIEGIAAYMAEDWDSTKTIYMQQALSSDRLKRLSTLQGKDANIVGQSIWHYISQRYGKDNVGNILNLTRIIRSEQSAISSSVGVPFSKFIKEWKTYYQQGAVAVPVTDAKTNNIALGAVKEAQTGVSSINLKQGEVDTENYEFDKENIAKAVNLSETKTREKTKKESTKTTKTNAKETLKLTGPFVYENRFINTESTTPVKIDPLRGLGINPIMTFTDLLENHVLKASIFVPATFRNVDYFGEYYYLANRMDYGIKVNRSALTEEANKNLITEIALVASYPFNKINRFSFAPTYFANRIITLGQLAEPDVFKTNVGFKTEYVFDNTQGSSVNISNGLRTKLGYQYFQGISSKAATLNRIYLDTRYYKTLFDKMIFAARFSASHSGGANAAKVYLGGVDNVLNNKAERFEKAVESQYFRDIYLAGFVTPLRGFGLNKISGNNHLLANIELRFPISKLLGQENVASGFLHDFELVTFTDIGTAWIGKSPFAKQNSLNTEVIGGGVNPFRATVTNFKNPFFASYGIGLRSVLFGYPIKADYAWGLEAKTTNEPILQISIGYDF